MMPAFLFDSFSKMLLSFDFLSLEGPDGDNSA